MKHCIAVAALIAGAGLAQQGADPAGLVTALGSADEIAVELAMRALCSLPKAQAPLDLLRAAAKKPGSHGPAVLVLAWFSALQAEDVLLDDRLDPALAAAALGCQPEAELRTLLGTAKAPGLARRTALEVLQDRSALTPADLTAAVSSDDEGLQRTALLVLRWEWPSVPVAVLDAVRASAVARWTFLQLLADAPRPACSAWARECAAEEGLAPAERLMALAAAGTDLDLAQGRTALRWLVGTDDLRIQLSFRCAMSRLPAKTALQLVGEAHRLCVQGLDTEVLMPFFDRLDQDGEVRLLGLASTLPLPAQEKLAWFLSQRNSPRYLERVRSALDGEVPLEAHLLPRTPGLLDRPARIQRVGAFLNDASSPAWARRQAFTALVAAAAPAEVLLPYVNAGAGQDWVELLRYYPKALPAELLDQALEHGGTARLAAFAAMEQHGVPRSLEPKLVDLVTAEGPDSGAAARVLAVAGSEAAGIPMWRAVRDRPKLREQILESFATARRPWVHELLLAELASKDAPAETDAESLQALRARVRALLVEIGDRRLLRELLAEADKVGPHWLRRARTAAPDLTAEQALRLVPMLDRVKSEAAVEILLWLSSCHDPAVQAVLQRTFRHSPDPELQEEALRALMAGPARAALLAELDAAMAKGPLDERMEMLAYAAVDLPGAPAEDDLRRWARLYLWAPLLAPEAELGRSLRVPDGRVGYPMAQAIMHTLRREPSAHTGKVFRAMAETVAADPRVRFLGRQRLMCLWHAATPDPELQRTLGHATADLLLQIPDPRRLGEGLGRLLAGEGAAAAGNFDKAAEHFVFAVRGLLRGGGSSLSARMVLGERDGTAFADPHAALAAAPWQCRARALLARGERAAALRQLETAFEIGWSDAATRKTLSAMISQLR